MIRKGLIFLLALTLITGFFNFTVFNSVSAAKNNYEIIEALGLTKGFNQNKINISDKVTRAELAAIAVTMAHPNLSYSIENVYFDDVKSDYWALKHIELAASLNIMRGNDGKFKPEDKVKYIDAVVTLVRVAGYENIAANRGGYPSGYLIVAAEKRITGGISLANDQSINFDELAKLVLNTLEAEMMLIDSIGNEVTFSSEKGKTVLTESLKYVKFRGILTENSFTSLAGASTLPENNVVINGERYNEGSTNAASYLGYNVTGYAKYDEEKNYSTILYIEQLNTKEFTINAEDIEETTRTKITYEVNDNLRTVNIPERVYVIYNNIYIDTWDENTFKPEAGKIKLVDNDMDNKYDIVFIETYLSYVIDSTNVNTGIIYDKYDLPPLLFEDDNLEAVIKFGNEEIKLGDLQEWDVLTVVLSKNEMGTRKIDAYLTRDSFSGMISGVDDEGIVVGEQYYKVGASLRSMVELGKISLQAGNDGRFYLDRYTNLVAYLDSQAGGPGNTNQYGYLYRASKNKGLMPGARFQIITSEAKMVIFDGAKKIKFSDGITEKTLSGEDYPSAPSFSENQVIMYNLNEMGEVRTIIFPIIGRDDSKFSIDGIFNSQTEKSPQNVLVTREQSGSFSVNDVYYNIDTARTLILALPNVQTGEEMLESQIEILHPDRLPQYEGKDDSGRYPDAAYYDGGLAVDLDETDTAGMILIKKPDWAGSSQWTQQTNHFIVSRVSNILAEDGEEETVVTGFFDGYDLALTKVRDANMQLDLSTVRQGDILQIMMTADRLKLINARRIFTLSDRPADGTAETNCIYYNTGGIKELYQTDRGPMYSECFIGLVRVEGCIEKNIKVSFDYNNTTITYPYKIQDYTKVTVIDRNTLKVYSGTEKDIGTGDRVYINSRDTQLRDIVILKD